MKDDTRKPEFRVFANGFSQWLPQPLVPVTVAKLWSLGLTSVYVENPSGGVRQADLDYNATYLSTGTLPSLDKSRAWKGYGR